MMVLKRFLIALMVLFCGATVASATDYYVDSGITSCADYDPTTFTCGSGSNQAYETIAQLEAAVTAATIGSGDKVYLRRGQSWADEFDTSADGGVGRITLSAFGSGALPKLGGAARSLDIRHDGWTFEYLDLTPTSDGALIYNTVQDVTIQNCTQTNGDYGVRFQTGTFTNIRVNNNVFTDQAQSALAGSSVTVVDSYINGNYITGTTGPGLNSLLMTYTNLTFSDNIILATGSYGAAITDITGGTFDGNQIIGCSNIGLYFVGHAENVDITDLTANGNSGAGVYFQNNGGGDLITNVTITDSTCNGDLTSDGIKIGDADSEGSNVTLTRCTANGNANDGINGKGAITSISVVDCSASLNLADGISFHNSCTGTIQQSFFKDNAKDQLINVDTSAFVVDTSIFIQEDVDATEPLVAFSGTGDNDLLNCTVWNKSAYADGPYYMSGGTNDVYNNIFIGGGTGVTQNGGTMNNDYNLTYGQTVAAYGGTSSPSAGSNDLTSNPELDSVYYRPSGSDPWTLFSSGSSDALGTDYYGVTQRFNFIGAVGGVAFPVGDGTLYLNPDHAEITVNSSIVNSEAK